MQDLLIKRRILPRGEYREGGYEAHQVVDISLQVTEYRAQVLIDAAGDRFVAKFPTRVTRPIQYRQFGQGSCSLSLAVPVVALPAHP